MKIYLIQNYKTDGKNVWSEPNAFTSKTQRDDVMHSMQKLGFDLEAQDVEVTKRPYIKQIPYDGVANKAQYEGEAAHAAQEEFSEHSI